MPEAAGRINVYCCETCDGNTITVNLAAGTTPMFLSCRAKPIYAPCGGRAVSCGYRCRQDLVPTHGWYAPTEKEERRLDPETRAHVRHGGLLLRALDPLERERYGARYRSSG